MNNSGDGARARGKGKRHNMNDKIFQFISHIYAFCKDNFFLFCFYVPCVSVCVLCMFSDKTGGVSFISMRNKYFILQINIGVETVINTPNYDYF